MNSRVMDSPQKQQVQSTSEITLHSELQTQNHSTSYSAIVFRALRDDDIAAVAALEQQLFGVGAWSADSVEQEVHAPARTYIVAAKQDQVVGYAGYWYDGDDAELMTIGVAHDYQGQGIASMLLQDLLERAKAEGAYRMLLEVRVDNDPALALYCKHGFTTMGRRKRYYQPEGIDAFTMSMTLNDKIVGFRAQSQQ